MKHIGYMRKELIRIYGKNDAKRIVESAKKHYAACMELCKDASKGERMHLENTILPVTSFYKALLEVDPTNALSNTKTILMNLCEKGGKVLNGVLNLPGMKSGFMKLMPKFAVKAFGTECGFDYVNFHADNSRLQMDMTVCPYLKYASIFRLFVDHISLRSTNTFGVKLGSPHPQKPLNTKRKNRTVSVRFYGCGGET